MLDPEVLTDEVLKALKNPTDENGKPVRNMPMLEAFCSAYVDQLKASQTLNPLVMALGTPIDAPSSPGEVKDGSAIGGKIIGFMPEPISQAMFDAVQSDLNTEAKVNIRKQNSIITSFVMTNALVNFSAGKITGECLALKASPPGFPGAPGPIVNGAGESGQISALIPAVLHGQLKAAFAFPGDLPYLMDFCKALCSFTMDNAEVTYKPGTVTGVFPPNGGPLGGGIGSNGMIK